MTPNISSTEKSLTIKDLNCSTCPNSEMRHSWGYINDRPRCKLTKWFLDFPSKDKTIQTEFIGVVGCASHPLALQVLAQPIIEKLNIESNEQYKIATRRRNSHAIGIYDGIQKAIELLKGGVSK